MSDSGISCVKLSPEQARILSLEEEMQIPEGTFISLKCGSVMGGGDILYWEYTIAGEKMEEILNEDR